MISPIRNRLTRLFCTAIQRQVLQYDVLVVGGGVAGLSTAIQIKKLQAQYERPISVCVIQKGNQVGDHILSGNCFETKAFEELFPKWKSMQNRPPIQTKVTKQQFHVLTSQNNSFHIPHVLFPKTINNIGNYVISLSKLTRWMQQQANELQIDIFPGTPGADLIYKDGVVSGVVTQDFGISKDGSHSADFQPGVQIRAKQTVLSQGARGSLTQKVIKKYGLRDQCDPPKYGIGLKQVWQVQNSQFQPGYLQHTVGWPLQKDVYGGSFLYHMAPNIVHVGLVVGLNYQNPYLNPYQQFQRMKLHPIIRRHLQGGNCISYGSRALNSQGYFSIPKLVFPGGVLTGCSAGLMNVLKIKGSHNAIKSGVQAGKAIYQKLAFPQKQNPHQNPDRVDKYQTNLKNSWVWDQLYQSRNFKNSFKNLYTGLAYGGFFKIFNGNQPFDIRSKQKDCDALKPKQNFKEIKYPKPDRKLTFDLLQNLARSGTNHSHSQPAHLVVKKGQQNDPKRSLQVFDGPEQRQYLFIMKILSCKGL